MKRKLFISLFLLLSFRVFASEEEKTPVIEISVDLGCGFYLGSFLDHLKADGAYTATPTLDFYLSTFFVPYAGLQFHTGCGSVIHPSSEPMEGVLIYMGLGPFFKWDSGLFTLKGWAQIGFQQPSMTLGWYGSGFFELGTHGGFDITETYGIVLGLKYRRQFLRSIIIHEKYDSIEENDNLSSLTLSAGWTVKI